MFSLHRFRHVAKSVVGTVWGSRTYLPDDCTRESEGRYPLELEFTLRDRSHFYGWFDDNGVPMRRYATSGLQYVPTRIAAYGLAHFNRWMRTRCEDDRATFLRMADWFMLASDARWRYHFAMPGLPSGWISCMAQGEGISVLTRAFTLTGDVAYLNQARGAAEPLTVPIAEGGVKSLIDEEWLFLEEYPLHRPRHTLNGFLYSLVGLLDLCEVEPHLRTTLGVDDFIRTLKRRWTLWDAGYWSKYDLHVSRAQMPNLATGQYHNIHVALLDYIASREHSIELEAVAKQWRMLATIPSCRLRAILAKIAYRTTEPAYV